MAEANGNIQPGSQEHSLLIQALTSGASSDPGYDATAETAAASDANGSTGDIDDSFGATHGQAATVTLVKDPAQYGKNGIPFQVRLVSGLQGDSFRIVKKQMYFPARPVQFNGEIVTPQSGGGISPTLGGWSDIPLTCTAVYLRITIDNTEGDWCDERTYKYTKPQVKAKWNNAHEETKVTEGKIEYSVALATDIPSVVGGSVAKNTYKLVKSSCVDVVDPFLHASHMLPVDVVTDIRFEDTGSEIKCHITRARVCCLKEYQQDATPKEDYKTKGENFEKMSDPEIPRVMKMTTTRIATNLSYQSNALTQAVYEDVRIIQKKGGTDPNSMAQPSSRTETVFAATPHSAEHV